MGLVAPSLTMEMAKKAALGHYTENGKRPSAASGDASSYLGLPPGFRSFHYINRWLFRLHHPMTLSKLCTEMGMGLKKGTTIKMARKAIQGYFAEHGRCPGSEAGDASQYLGLPAKGRSFQQLDSWLRYNKDTSLRRLGFEMNLRVPFQQSLGKARRAIFGFSEEHGVPPTQNSGDASKYLGLPANTWLFSAIDGWLRYRGSSVFRERNATRPQEEPE